MKIALKAVLIVVGIVVILVVALVGYISLVFDPNDYKPQIAQAVEQKTGRQVSIPGTIGLSVFPWLGIDMGRVEVANAKGFGDKPFASIDSAAASIKILPLLHKQVELGSLTLQGLTVRLARDKQGRNNWSDISKRLSGESAGKPAPPPQPKPGSGGESGGFTLNSLQVAGVQVKDAQVFWDDASTDTHYHLRDFALRTGKIELGKPFTLNVSFDLDSREPQYTAGVKLVSQVTADPQREVYDLGDLQLTIDGHGDAVPGGKQQIELTGGATADLKAQTASVDDLVLKVAGLVAHAQMKGTKILGQPQFQGTMKVEPFSPRDVFAKLDMTPPPTQDEAVLGKASLDSSFTAGTDKIGLSDLKIVLDDTHLTGTAAVNNFSKPAIRFDLAVDAIDADRYLPPPAEGESAGAKPAADTSKKPGTSVAATPIDLEALKPLDVAGKLSIGKLKAMGLRMHDASVQLTAKDGVLRVEPLTAELYEGKLTATSTIKAAGNQSYAFTVNASGIQAGPMLKDMADNGLIDGTGNLKLDLHSTGKTVGAVRQALAGTLSFAFRDGAINGFNLAEIIRNAKARLTGQNVTRGAPLKTDFSELTGSARVDQGILTNDDMELKSPLFRVTGKGKVNLVDNTLDYLVRASVVNTLKGQGGNELADLRGVTVPIQLSGDMMSPKYRLDLAAALASVQSERVDEAKEKAKERLKENEQKLRDKAREKLQDLFH